jgi:D-aminoacyl-tRNA deacylase
MRAVIQRVSEAKVEIDGQTAGQIGNGLLVYLGVGRGDDLKDASYISNKIVELRIFPDEADKMDRSVIDVSGDVLLISNFTLQGDCRKGRRPSFDPAAEPALAKQLYEKVGELIKAVGVEVQTGIFAAHMHISSVNDGPVTFVLDSKD